VGRVDVDVGRLAQVRPGAYVGNRLRGAGRASWYRSGLPDFDERAALIHEDPETFAVTPHYERYPGVLVRLPTVPQDHLREC
jgi:hypothetical protein